jgi:predicted transcriptional regulator
MSILNPREHKILKALLEHNYRLTTTQVSKIANMSWNTVNKYLNKFYEKGWIDKQPKGKWVYWRAYR